jgi:putative chitinase
MADLVSATTLNKLFPQNKTTDKLAMSLNKILPKYDITSKLRLASFLSQCGHESGGFVRSIENLNYSAKGLCATFPKRFPTLESAQQYQRNPEKIANRVYCNRIGNGDEQSGDGWKFRGRGFIQLTGKSNYIAFSKYISKSLEETVQYCETLDGAIESACFFWYCNDLNRFADNQATVALTKAINGGLNGLEDRTAIYNQAMKLL